MATESASRVTPKADTGKMSSLERGLSMFENDLHINCTKDFLRLAKE